MMAVLLSSLLLAHLWYDSSCCADRDCKPVSCDEIRVDGLGWTWRQVSFTRKMMKVSQDGRCHVCVGDPSGDAVAPQGICIYLPPQT